MNQFTLVSPAQVAALRAQLRPIGLGALSLPPIHRGAAFALGVQTSDWTYLFATTTPDQLFDAVANNINASGYAEGVTVTAPAGIVNLWLEVRGRSGREYGSASHLKDAVLSVMQNIVGLDLSTVKFEAETYEPYSPQANGQGGNTQSGNVQQYPYQSNVTTYQAANDDQIKLKNEKGFLDQLAETFGLSRTEAALLGGFSVLLLVFALKR